MTRSWMLTGWIIYVVLPPDRPLKKAEEDLLAAVAEMRKEYFGGVVF